MNDFRASFCGCPEILEEFAAYFMKGVCLRHGAVKGTVMYLHQQSVLRDFSAIADYGLIHRMLKGKVDDTPV